MLHSFLKQMENLHPTTYVGHLPQKLLNNAIINILQYLITNWLAVLYSPTNVMWNKQEQIIKAYMLAANKHWDLDLHHEVVLQAGCSVSLIRALRRTAQVHLMNIWIKWNYKLLDEYFIFWIFKPWPFSHSKPFQQTITCTNYQHHMYLSIYEPAFVLFTTQYCNKTALLWQNLQGTNDTGF